MQNNIILLLSNRLKLDIFATNIIIIYCYRYDSFLSFDIYSKKYIHKVGWFVI